MNHIWEQKTLQGFIWVDHLQMDLYEMVDCPLPQDALQKG